MDINWKDPSVELPTEEEVIVWIYDPDIKHPVQPAMWYKKFKNFAAQGGWFEVNEIKRWAYAELPNKPIV